MSLEGVVILNLGCGYIENGVVISVSHKNPSESCLSAKSKSISRHANQPLNYSATMPSPLPQPLKIIAISHHANYAHYAHQQSCQFSYHAYQPLCLPAIWSVFATFKPFSFFSVAKVTLELKMSVCTSVCLRNPSASEKQANLPLCLSIDLSDPYQLSCQSSIMAICHPASPPSPWQLLCQSSINPISHCDL